jgi:hypothetical protein
MILLCNHKNTEFGKPHAYHGPVCALGNCQWWREPYFVGTAISQVDESALDILPTSHYDQLLTQIVMCEHINECYLP